MKSKLLLFVFSLVLIVSNIITTTPAVHSLPAEFDPGMVLSDQDLYSLPLAFSSADRIQAYLESTGSVLASHRPTIGFEDQGRENYADTDDLIIDSVFATVHSRFRARDNIQTPYGGQTMRMADLIWKMTRERFGNTCIINYGISPYRASSDICIDMEARPINPGFILAMIQKESGLIYGSCAGTDAQNSSGCQSVDFRLERILGYACFENPDRSRSCYDENPNWKFYKGPFKQIFRSIRLLRIREESCKLGGSFAFQSNGNVFQVGNTVNISNQQIVLKNGITCAMYIYTPHVSSQNLTYNVMKQIRIDNNYVELRGIDPNYNPRIAKPF